MKVPDHHSPGQLIARRYVVVSYLGKGAAGVVYLCHEINDPNNLKAIKVLSNFHENSPLFERFYQEGQVAKRIKSPHVVNSYDIIVDDGVFAFTMEYVNGESLEELLARSPLPTLPFIYRSLREICLGLIAIHQAGLVHRDLKPSNVLVDEKNHLKITDFGIVHQLKELNHNARKKSLGDIFASLIGKKSAKENNITKHGEIVGTVNYLSPEYIEHGLIDERSDLFALGIMTYQMLTGDLPFASQETMRKIISIVTCPIPDIRILRPDIPHSFSHLTMSCLNRDPNKRPQRAEEYLSLLDSIIEQEDCFSEDNDLKKSSQDVQKMSSGRIIY